MHKVSEETKAEVAAIRARFAVAENVKVYMTNKAAAAWAAKREDEGFKTEIWERAFKQYVVRWWKE